MSDPEPTTKPAKPPGSSKLPLLVAILNLGATGFIVFKMMTAPHAAAAAAHAAAEPTGPSSEVSGPVVKLDPFVVNLNEPGQPRYLKVSIEIELSSGDSSRVFDKAKQIIRDQALGYLSNLKLADTLGEQGKDKIRTDLIARLETVIGAGRVKRMFFSEFVVQ